MNHKSFFKQIFLLAVVVVLYSCDKDYNVLGSDVIGDNHFDFDKTTYEVLAYNKQIGSIESNNLPVNALGIYDNSVFGVTTANYATQVVLEKTSPEIGNNPVVESVILNVPYFIDASKTKVKQDGSSTYVLDSIFGPETGKIKLSVYESGRSMENLAPIDGVMVQQKFFTDQNAYFDGGKIGSRLNDDVDPTQNDAFFFDEKEHVEVTKDPVTDKEIIVRTKPGMRLKLNHDFFRDKIIKASKSNLASDGAFKNHFKGLYFKVEKSGGSDSNMALMDFSAGKVTIKYKEDLSTTVAGVVTITRVSKEIVIKLAGGSVNNKTGNTASLLEQSNTTTGYANAIANPNVTLGDSRLYLKGGEGALTVIDLFKTPGELEAIRKNKWLVNEASLVFYIDTKTMEKGEEPSRIYLYDLTNNRPLVDYGDVSLGTNAKNGKVIFDGNLKKTVGPNGRGITYRFRITNHIRNLISDAKAVNVQLGLVVTENINDAVSYKLKVANAPVSEAPRASVMSPLGTVLFGNNIALGDPDYAENYKKRLKLEVVYSKPN